MLYLASTSPRRRQLLTDLGIPFRLVAPGPEPDGEGQPRVLAEQRARSKALGAALEVATGLVLGVDTVVERHGRELGKPRDRADAQRMLELLAGGEHEVHTALCLVVQPQLRCLEAVATAVVRCGAVAPEVLARYLDSNAWRGKAGAYGIQDPEADFMQLVAGDRDTVVGLPLRLLRELLQRAGERPP